MEIHIATAENNESTIEAIKSVTNNAFMADTFFKKPEFHLRFTTDDVISLINSDQSMFLVATHYDVVVGSLYLHWEVLRCPHSIEVTGKFSAVSVPTEYSRHGIGKKLVKSAEEYVLKIAEAEKSKSQESSLLISANIEMGVINLRENLFPWYEAQGYRKIGPLPKDAELNRIVSDDKSETVWCVLMRKELL